jgi:hypothetical protein
MACAICQTRRPKRFCPGVRGDICTICCGQEREVTVNCPLDCEYLQDSRRHDKPVPLDTENLPHPDIRVTEKLLDENEELVIFLSASLSKAAQEIPGATDFDIREALDALIRTYRTLQSGIYYETRPDNAVARDVFDAVQRIVADFRREEQQRTGMAKTRDADILLVLAFLQRLELDRNNGRRRSRAFIDMLRGFYPAAEGKASSLVLP